MDKALKQRLVGASVLIALAVIVLPMLLGGRPEGGTQQTQKIELPRQPPELDFDTRRYPIGEQASASRGKAHSDEADETVTQLPAPRKTAVTPAATDEAANTESGDPAGDGPVAAASAAAPISVRDAGESDSLGQEQQSVPPADSRADSGSASTAGRYVVQVASFGALENANRLSSVLKESGYFVMSDRVKSDMGTLHRVRVGPFDSEAEASRAVQALESKISGVKPRVVDLQPEQAAQVTTPADPLVRWVVQVGSFSNAANAEKLVASLRNDGMSAYQETISSSGSDIYRVRIGPFLQREEAMRTERRVREDRSLNGVVMSAD